MFGFRNTSTSGLPDGFCLSIRFAPWTGIIPWGANLRVRGGRAAAASRPRDLCSLGGSSVLCAWSSRSIRCHVIPFWESVGCPPPQSSGELGWRQRVGGWASLGAPARKLSSCWLPDGSIIKWDWARHDSRHSRGDGRDLVVYVG